MHVFTKLTLYPLGPDGEGGPGGPGGPYQLKQYGIHVHTYTCTQDWVVNSQEVLDLQVFPSSHDRLLVPEENLDVGTIGSN